MADERVFYVMGNGKISGPFQGIEVHRLAAEGKIGPFEFIKKGEGAWVRAQEVVGLQFGPPATMSRVEPSIDTAAVFAPPPGSITSDDYVTGFGDDCVRFTLTCLRRLAGATAMIAFAMVVFGVTTNTGDSGALAMKAWGWVSSCTAFFLITTIAIELRAIRAILLMRK